MSRAIIYLWLLFQRWILGDKIGIRDINFEAITVVCVDRSWYGGVYKFFLTENMCSPSLTCGEQRELYNLISSLC